MSSTTRPAWQRWILRHLFVYLAVIAGLSVLFSVLVAREDLWAAVRAFPATMVLPVIGLTVLNYALRFAKWDRLLTDSDIRINRGSSASIYFACLAMVVTPARLGELYKLVFLRKLHGIRAARSLPPLVLERATDVLALLALCAAQPFRGGARFAGIALAALAMVGFGAILAAPVTRQPLLRMLGALPGLRSRTDRIGEIVEGHARLLAPRSLAPNLGLSILAWWAECTGLWLICLALGSAPLFGDATWIYSASTLLGNLTFLPGGLGGTEFALKTLLERVGVLDTVALAATLLVRAATLWFAVFLGLVVTLIRRRHLHWTEVREEAASE